MRRAFTILLILYSGGLVAQIDLRTLLSASADVTDTRQVREELDAFIQPLSGVRASDQKLLRKTFNRLHAVYLKKYEAYADFGDVFVTGRYDCLTATALFSYVLDQLKFPYDIIETNYHIFLVVKTSGGDVLLETTDRFDGFITDEDAISQRIGEYGKNQLPVDDHSSKYYYHYSFSLLQKISPQKLTGLLYFNQAVKAYNRQDWEQSSILLETANTLYASPRCEALSAILIRTLIDSSLDEQTKTACINRLRNFWAKHEPVALTNFE